MIQPESDEPIAGGREDACHRGEKERGESMGVGGGRVRGRGAGTTFVVALLLVLGLLMAAPAWAQSDTAEDVGEATTESVEDATKQQKETEAVETETETDEQQEEGDAATQEDAAAEEDPAAALESLTAAEVAAISCVQILQYSSELVEDPRGGQTFDVFEERVFECQRGVIAGTIPGGKLPVTGGLPLMGGGALLGLALVGTGISIVRSRRG